jgi:hypothetical protein
MLQMLGESFVFGRLFLGHEIPFVFVIRVCPAYPMKDGTDNGS